MFITLRILWVLVLGKNMCPQIISFNTLMYGGETSDDLSGWSTMTWLVVIWSGDVQDAVCLLWSGNLVLHITMFLSVTISMKLFPLLLVLESVWADSALEDILISHFGVEIANNNFFVILGIAVARFIQHAVEFIFDHLVSILSVALKYPFFLKKRTSTSTLFFCK